MRTIALTCGAVRPSFPPCALDRGHKGPHAWEAPERVPTRDITKQLLVDSTELAAGGHAYHVIAAHQTDEERCAWPVCKRVRETRDGIEKLVERLTEEGLTT